MQRKSEAAPNSGRGTCPPGCHRPVWLLYITPLGRLSWRPFVTRATGR